MLEPWPLTMTNAEIAAVLEQIADLLEFQGSNPFRVRAYRRGARAIHDLPESVEQILDAPDRQLTDIDGIGKDLADKVATLAATGSLAILDELLSQVPATVLDLLRVAGLGPKRAAILYRELLITSLDELREACQAQRVRRLKGFGAKTEATILEGLETASRATGRIYWAQADSIAQSIRRHLGSCEAVERMELAGSYRRGKDTVGDLDILAVAKNAKEVMDSLEEYGDVDEVLLRGNTKMSIRMDSGLQVDLRVVPAESFGAALQYFTGSKDHNVVLRGMAKARELKINEYGVFRGKEQIAGRTEEDVYAALDLPCFPPELREARREFEWAAAGQLPELVRLCDIKGDLHVHSTWTDGHAKIEEVAHAAQRRGLEYLAITDHSKRVAMAGGLDAARLRRQWAEIDELNERMRQFTILKGIEVDILERGGLDLDDEVLAEADWVVASVHYGQNQPRDQITRRVVEALENPAVSAIAHPTGRLLNRRNAYQIDLDAVLQAAADYGKMMELNCHPARLDLDDIGCAAAKNRGVPIVVSTDAHSTNGLETMRFGVLQARRGGLSKQDVANTRTWAEMKSLIGKRR